MSNTPFIFSIFNLQNFAVENGMENLRIYFCTDLYTLAMTQVMNVIEPYKIINVSVKQHGVFEKHNWETDMPYIKYQELLCEMIDRIELADKEYYED